MPVRGPAQLLLPFFRSGVRNGWIVAAAAGVAVLIALLGSGAYLVAKKDLVQIVRQSAWRTALSGEPPAKSWPWNETGSASSPNVVRLGLSATVHDGEDDHALDRRNLDQRDPHLPTGNLAVGDHITVTTVTGQSQVYMVMGQGAADPHLSADARSEGDHAPACMSVGNAERSSFRLIIEAIKSRPKATLQTGHEHKL